MYASNASNFGLPISIISFFQNIAFNCQNVVSSNNLTIRLIYELVKNSVAAFTQQEPSKIDLLSYLIAVFVFIIYLSFRRRIGFHIFTPINQQNSET